MEIISERDFQDYMGRYQDLRDEWKSRRENNMAKTDITDDVIFEIELIRQIEINIDYILALVSKYHEGHCEDKEVLVTIRKAVDASPELRSKKHLIEQFIEEERDGDGSNVADKWNSFLSEECEKELKHVIKEENLKEPETRKFIENAFRSGEFKTSGTDIDKRTYQSGGR